ncbi:MAG: choice-of-anchor D domain-containing protein [Bacteroides sp.]|nr:choice-of-anchor D domain-containing protein [Bacteroides sp.]
MKRKLQLAIPWFMALFLFLSFNSPGQGLETFDNLDLTGTSYLDGTFLGQDGSTWTYEQCRGDIAITGNAIMLGRNRTPQPNVYSGTISGGIGIINFDYMQAFSTNVNLNVLVNDVLVGNVTSAGEANIVKNSGDITVNVGGDVVIKFINANNSDGQVVIDNISWTAAGAVTQVATPSLSPNGGDFYAPIDVSISTLTEGATIYYTTDGTDPDATATLYTAPFEVSSTTTVKAIGIKEGLDDSNIASATFNFPAVTDVATIAGLRAGLTDGTAYRLTGEALITAMDGFNNRKFIQDGTAAIMIFDNQGIIDTEYSIGDKIQNISGTLSLANNLLRFVPVADPGAAVSTGNPVVPTVFTLDGVTTDDQAKLVTFKNVTFSSIGTFANGQNYTLTDGTNTFVMRTDFWNVDYIGTEIPTTPHNITGVIIQYNTTLQIVPRSLADFYEIPFNTHFQFAAVDGTLPAWFGADTERGMAAGGGSLYAVSRNAGNFVRVFDPVTGLETGTLNTTGVSGGTFALNDAEVSGDGVVLAANMAMNTSVDGTAVFKVYQMDAVAAPVAVIEYALPGIARLGDKFTVVGNFDDGSATLYAADGSNPRVFKFTLTGGVFGAPEIIPLGVTQGSTPAVAPLPDGSFYYNANGQSLSKLNADGTLVGTVPGGIISTGSNSIKYLGTDGDDEMVAVFNYGVGQERIKVIRVPAGDPSLATLEFETPSMRGNANANGAGDVAFIPGLDGSVHLYILATNNGFAGYESLNLNLVFPDYTGGTPSYDITTFPYHQNFNDEVFPADGYQNLAVVGTGTWTRLTSGTNPTTSPQDGAGMIRYNAYSQSSGNSAALITPKVVIPAGDYQVRFSMYRDGGYLTNADRVEVLVNDTPDLTDAVSIGVVNRSINLEPVVTSAGWHYFAFPFPVEKAGDYYVIFKAISAYGNNIYVDAFFLEEVPTQPQLAVVPTSLDFGLVLEGTTSASKSLALTNVAVGSLQINDGDITLTGTDAAMFSLGDITYPIEIGPSATVNISLDFTPAAVGDYTATLNIAHNGSNSPTTVDITGSGYAPFAAFFENFDLATVGGLPSAWANYVQATSTAAAVDVTTAGTPVSAPNQIRMANSSDANATLLLITPAVTNITSNRIGFMAKGTNYVLQVGTITDPADPTTFTVLQAITLTSAHEQYYVNFDEYTGTDQYIAFKHGLGATYRTIYMDNVVWEAIPADPVFAVSPESKDFGMLQIEQTSNPQTFTISNTGAGTLVINPADITLTGTDAAEFVLTNLAETAELAFGETATFTVAFAPVTVGVKSATIEINDNLTGKVINQIPLTGEGFDATLYPTFVVDFNEEPFPPLGWGKFIGLLGETTTLEPTTSGWSHHVFGNLSGEDNSAYINIYSTKNHWLITPPIDLGDGTTDYQLSFDIALTPWTGTAQSTLGPDDYVAVVISTDNGMTWTNANVLIDWDASDVISATGNHIVVSLVGYSGLVKVGFYAERPSGSTPDLRFYVDNVSVEDAAEVPVFTISPDSKDFGDVGVTEQSQPQTFIISNSGPGTLMVNAPVLDNTTDYILNYTAEDFPAELTGTETVSFTVAFAPQTEGILTGEVTIAHGEAGAETATVPLTGAGVVRPAGSTCANPYVFDALPLVDYADNTEAYGNDYLGAWLEPSSNYLNGYDFVGQFTLDEAGYLSGSVAGSWTGLIIVEECPNIDVPANVLALGTGTSGGAFNNVWMEAGTYFAIVSTWPSPDFTDFTLNLSFMTGYTVTFAVQDEDAIAITDAVVTLGDVTNEAGNYVFENVIPGTYAYTVVKEGYVDGTGDVEVIDANVTETVTLQLAEQPMARMQIIHNSADAAVNLVDIYVNGDLFLEDFAFRTATPFVDVPAGVDLDIIVAPAGAGIENGVGPVTLNLGEGGTYIAIANGIVSASGYDPAPAFSLDVMPAALESAISGNTEVLAFHGSTDAPTVSVWETGVGAGELFTFSYGDFAGYLLLNTADYVLEIRTADGETTVAAYSAPLATLGLDGAAITVVASGFLDPANNSDGAAFGLYVALAGGGDLVALPLYTETFEVTFNVDMTYAEGFDPETDVVYITGDLLGWAEPGTDPDNQTMARVDDSMVWTKTLQLEAGSYEYKYFLNAGWDGGEWDGGDNRSLVVEGDMEVNDWFGYLTDPTSVTDPSLAQIRIFPVPAQTNLTITSPMLIREVRMIDMLGQMVYNETVSGMQHQLNVGQFKNGIYFIQILTDKGMETRRIQIQK